MIITQTADRPQGTALDIALLLGTCVFLEPIEGFLIQCRVTNAKTAYGRPRLQIEPLAGEGRAWVSVDKTRPCDPASPDAQAAAEGRG